MGPTGRPALRRSGSAWPPAVRRGQGTWLERVAGAAHWRTVVVSPETPETQRVSSEALAKEVSPLYVVRRGQELFFFSLRTLVHTPQRVSTCGPCTGTGSVRDWRLGKPSEIGSCEALRGLGGEWRRVFHP